jgi:hypothetical protein
MFFTLFGCPQFLACGEKREVYRLASCIFHSKQNEYKCWVLVANITADVVAFYISVMWLCITHQSITCGKKAFNPGL